MSLGKLKNIYEKKIACIKKKFKIGHENINDVNVNSSSNLDCCLLHKVLPCHILLNINIKKSSAIY